MQFSLFLAVCMTSMKMLGIYSTVPRVCPSFIYHDNVTQRNYTIKESQVGEPSNTAETCPLDKRPMGEMACQGVELNGAIRGDFKLNQQCNLSDLSDSAISNDLRSLLEVDESGVLKVLGYVDTLTKNVTLTELDLLYVATILEKTNNVKLISDSELKSVLSIYSGILRSSEETLVKSQERRNIGNRVLETLDNITSKLTPNRDGYNKIQTADLVTEVWDIKGTNVSDSHELSDIGLQFPEGTLQNIAKRVNGTKIHFSVTTYKDPRLFNLSQNPSYNSANYTLNSKVIGVKIIADGDEVLVRDVNVTTFFKPQKDVSRNYRSDVTDCAYWDFTGNNNSGSWSTDGCRYAGVKDGRDVCVCDHLTNFAILMDVDSLKDIDPTHSLALSVITVTGLSLSIAGLTGTIFTFSMFRRLRETHTQLTLFNLAIAELCSWTVFLTGINQTQNNVGCVMAAALLHYFLLASFMWMLAEAVLHYRLFVKVLGTYTSRYMLKTGIPAWGIPLVPVVAVLAIDINLYVKDNTYCWLSSPTFFYAFALPVGLIIFCNSVLYVCVVISICRKSTATMSEDAKKSRDRVNVRVSIMTFVLFGLSWIFGFLAVSDAKVVFQYIFCVTSSTQGFLIFLLFTAGNRNVRDSWLAWCCKQKQASSYPSTYRLTSGERNVAVRKTEKTSCEVSL